MTSKRLFKTTIILAIILLCCQSLKAGITTANCPNAIAIRFECDSTNTLKTIFSDTFTHSSTAKWKWQVNCEGKTIAQSAAKEFFVSGFQGKNIDATLTVTTAGKSCVSRLSTKVPEAITADFTAPDMVCDNTEIQLAWQGKGDTSQFEWEFTGAITAFIHNQSTVTYRFSKTHYSRAEVSLAVSDKYRCQSSASKSIEIMKNWMGNFTVVPNEISKCGEGVDTITLLQNAGAIFQIHLTKPVSYRWSNGEITTENKLVVSSSGVYQATVSDQYGCETRSNSITVNYIPLPVAALRADSSFFGDGKIALSHAAVNQHGCKWFLQSKKDKEFKEIAQTENPAVFSIFKKLKASINDASIYALVTDRATGCSAKTETIRLQKIKSNKQQGVVFVKAIRSSSKGIQSVSSRTEFCVPILESKAIR